MKGRFGLKGLFGLAVIAVVAAKVLRHGSKYDFAAHKRHSHWNRRRSNEA